MEATYRMFSGLFNDAPYIASNVWVTDELRWIWKEVLVA
jgi:hypothetical protein